MKYIVLFEVIPTKEGKAKYLELAASLKELLPEVEGFERAERFQSLADENKILSLNAWESEEAMSNWRNTIQHRMSQLEGKNTLFESYKISVVQVIREYTDKDRAQAPKDSQAFFEK